VIADTVSRVAPIGRRASRDSNDTESRMRTESRPVRAAIHAGLVRSDRFRPLRWHLGTQRVGLLLARTLATIRRSEFSLASPRTSRVARPTTLLSPRSSLLGRVSTGRSTSPQHLPSPTFGSSRKTMVQPQMPLPPCFSLGHWDCGFLRFASGRLGCVNVGAVHCSAFERGFFPHEWSSISRIAATSPSPTNPNTFSVPWISAMVSYGSGAIDVARESP
jgi:hypothetical protein